MRIRVFSIQVGIPFGHLELCSQANVVDAAITPLSTEAEIRDVIYKAADVIGNE